MIKSYNNKISVQQLLSLFVLSLLTPVTRLFPTAAARIAGRAGWLSPLAAAVPPLIIVLCVSALMKNVREGDNVRCLAGIYQKVFGKVIGKTVLAVYFLWLSLLYLLYIRYYGERALSTIFVNADLRFFIGIMMFLVYIAVRGRIESLGRFGEISMLFFLLLVAGFILLMLPGVKLRRLGPVTYYDAVPAVRGALPLISVFSVFIAFFFLCDNVTGMDKLKHKGKISVLSLTIMSVAIVAITFGSLDYRLIAKMPMPFFSSLKLVTFIQPFDRLETLLLSAWVLADFVLIASLAAIIARLGSKLFDADESKYCAAPVAVFGFIGSCTLASNRFIMEGFSQSVFLSVVSLIMSV
ncbi:MAG: spore germination protein, partial [Oscillospiraceae bacterium]|nr:spore germination protein [Oscillospiraceae bacterium]